MHFWLHCGCWSIPYPPLPLNHHLTHRPRFPGSHNTRQQSLRFRLFLKFEGGSTRFVQTLKLRFECLRKRHSTNVNSHHNVVSTSISPSSTSTSYKPATAKSNQQSNICVIALRHCVMLPVIWKWHNISTRRKLTICWSCWSSHRRTICRLNKSSDIFRRWFFQGSDTI